MDTGIINLEETPGGEEKWNHPDAGAATSQSIIRNDPHTHTHTSHLYC
jgi:hypothetical protein